MSQKKLEKWLPSKVGNMLNKTFMKITITILLSIFFFYSSIYIVNSRAIAGEICGKYKVTLKSEFWESNTKDINNIRKKYNYTLQSANNIHGYTGFWILTQKQIIELLDESEGFNQTSYQCINEEISDYFHMRCETIDDLTSKRTECEGLGYFFYVKNNQVYGPIITQDELALTCLSSIPISMKNGTKWAYRIYRDKNIRPEDQTKMPPSIGTINNGLMSLKIDGINFIGSIECLETKKEKENRIFNQIEKLINELNEKYVGMKRIEWSTGGIGNSTDIEYEITEFNTFKSKEISDQAIHCIVGDNLHQIMQVERTRPLGTENWGNSKIKTTIGYFDGNYFYSIDYFRKLFSLDIYNDPSTPEEDLAFAIDLALFAVEIGVLNRAFKCVKEISPIAHAPKNTRFIEGIKVVDRRTGIVFEGTVDLKPTLDRIARGESFPHINDGRPFENRPLRGETTAKLPSKPYGYYKEYVHPTPGLTGPGPQRIVTGKGGEIYYTPDHYKTFITVNP